MTLSAAEDDALDDLEYRRLRLDEFFDEDEDMPDDFDPAKQTYVDYNFVADYGWDPLQLSRFDLNLGGAADKQRPLQVVIRDYREVRQKASNPRLSPTADMLGSPRSGRRSSVMAAWPCLPAWRGLCRSC